MYALVKFYRGSKAEAWAEARRLEDFSGGHVMLGEYLEGIEAWEILQGPPLVKDERIIADAIATDYALS